jgi:hypothetical protein
VGRRQALTAGARGPLSAPAPAAAAAKPTSAVADGDVNHVGSKAWRAKVAETRPKAYTPWTPEEEAQLLEGVAQGLKVRALARLHQRKLGAIEASSDR